MSGGSGFHKCICCRSKAAPGDAGTPARSRCRFCNTPFQGIGGMLARMLPGKQRSTMNPRYCNLCEIVSREFPGGAEVECMTYFTNMEEIESKKAALIKVLKDLIKLQKNKVSV